MFFLIKVNYRIAQEDQIQIDEQTDVSYESADMNDWVIVNADDRVVALEKVKNFYATTFENNSSPVLVKNPNLKICYINEIESQIHSLDTSFEEEEENGE